MRMIAMWPPRGPTDTAPDAVRQDRPAEAATMAALASWLAADGDGTTGKNDQIQAPAAQAASTEAQGRARPCRPPHRARLGACRSVRQQGPPQRLRPVSLAETLNSHRAASG